MSKDVDQLDAVLLHSSLSEIAQKLNDMASKDWWWDFGAPVITAAIVALIASGLTFWYTYHLHKRAEKTAEERYNKSLIDQKRRQIEEQLEQDKRHRENQLIFRENINREAINEVTLLANRCFTNLSVIRSNYSALLSSSLHERMFQVPIIKSVIFEAVDFSVLTKLHFLTPLEGEEGAKWSQVTKIEALFANYNVLMLMWEERNELREQVHEELIEKGFFERERVEPAYIFLNSSTRGKCVNFTERVLSLTKELYVDLGDFLSGFNNAYEPLLDQSLPQDLLTKVVRFPSSDVARRIDLYATEKLADLEALKEHFSDEQFERFFKNARARQDIL